MSKLIKASMYYTVDDKKLIEVTQQSALTAAYADEHGQSLSPGQEQELNEARSMRDQIVRDAEAYAEEQVRQAAEAANALQEQARHDIESWWNEQRRLDQQAAAEARNNGYEAGFKEGRAKAEAAVRQEHSAILEEARAILERAHQVKQQIIQEAEPFLIGLSCSIAEKIIHKQLTVSPGWITDMTKTVLSRRRERGLITLCVSPRHYSHFQDAREELMMAVDSQAELQIIPDATVSDLGCVVRSSFGSIDARIDTQLKEIKAALQQLAHHEERETVDE